MFKYIASIFIFTILCSCGKYRKVTDSDQNSKFYNISYGEHKKQKMDVFVPNVIQDSAIVVLIHGGGWRFGSKGHLRAVQRYLLQNGISSASINYRLANREINYRHQLDDLDAAVHFINDSINHKRDLVLLGESSGGHIALLYAYRNPEIAEKVITFAAPTDFYSEKLQRMRMYRRFTKLPFSRSVGERYRLKDGIPKSFEEASPVSQVSNVPTFIFQGTWDMLVNKNQALALDSVLSVKGIKHELILIKGANHTPRLMPWWRNKIYDKVKEIVVTDY